MEGYIWAIIFFVAIHILYLIIKKFVIVVEQGTAVIIERFGRFERVCKCGLQFLVPFMHKPRVVLWGSYDVFSMNSRNSEAVFNEVKSHKIGLLHAVHDLPSQSIITRDNVEIMVHPIMRLQIHDPVRMAYETFDLYDAVEKLVQTTLRSVIGDMGLDDTLASRQEIESLVSNKVYKIFHDWGIKLISVDMLEIEPNANIQAAMHEQIKAERYRRTMKVTAEGTAEQVRLLAEGQCQAWKSTATGESESLKLMAKGHADARLIIAEKTAEAIRCIGDAVKSTNSDPTAYLIGMQYINALKSITSNVQVNLYFPLQTDVTGLAGSL